MTEEDCEAVRTAILELKGTTKVLHQHAFETFKKLLAASLQVQFGTIAEDQCGTSDYVMLKGARSKESLGHIQKAFSPFPFADSVCLARKTWPKPCFA